MKRLTIIMVLWGVLGTLVWGQMDGNYRSKQSGDWDAISTWEYFDGSDWVDAVNPPSVEYESVVDLEVTIRNSHTVNATGDIHSNLEEGILIIEAGGTLDMGSYALNGVAEEIYGFYSIIINGTLTTNNYVNYVNLEIGENGLFSTAYHNITDGAWWNDNLENPPESTILNGTVEYSRDGDQLIYSGFIFENLSLAGSGTKTTTNTITIEGDFTIHEDVTFDQYHSISFEGTDLTNNGTYSTSNSSIVTLYVRGNLKGSGLFSITGIDIRNDASTSLSVSTTNTISCNRFSIYGSVTIEPSTKISTVANLSSFYKSATGSLRIKSSASETASIIPQSISLNSTNPVITEKYLSGGEWHIISPLTTQSINGFLTNSNNDISFTDPDYAMTTYLEDKGSGSGGWDSYFTSSTSGNFSFGKGYLLRLESNSVVEFSGAIRAANVNINITRNAHGWNCIGNPFPSAIGVRTGASSTDNFLAENSDQLDGDYAALYIFDPDNPDVYQIINNTDPGGKYISQDYINTGQGFLVKSKTGGGTVSFTKDMRYHQNSETFYKKSAKAVWPNINLKVQASEKEANTNILFHENMTRGVDVTYDAGLFGGDPALKIYTKLVEDNGVNFAIQCLPDDEIQEMIVPVGLNMKDGGTVTFSAETFSLPPGYKAILEDKQTGDLTDLQLPSATYTTVIPTGAEGTGRFFLNVVSSTTGIAPADKQNITVFAHGKEIFIQGLVKENSTASVYDITGKLLVSYRLEPDPANINSFRVDELKKGIYIVKVEGKAKVETGRIYLE